MRIAEQSSGRGAWLVCLSRAMATSKKEASAPSRRISQRHLEAKVLHDEHAHLCRTLSTSDVIDELYSARVITSYQVDKVNAADTRRDKNRRLLRYLQGRRYPVTDLCSILDEHEPFKYLAKELRAAVEKMRKEHEKREHERKGHSKCSVSPQQLEIRKRKLSDDRRQFSVLMGKLGMVLDCHPEVLEPMKTAMKFATVPDGDDPLLSIVQSRSFIKAQTPSALLGTLAPAANVLDDSYIRMLVEVAGVPEAMEIFEAYLKTKDSSQQLVIYAGRNAEFLYPPPPRSEAAAMGFKEMVVRTDWEGVAMGEVQEMKKDVGGVLNAPMEAFVTQGVQESSLSVIFWISERPIPFIQSEYISLNHLHFLCVEGVLEIRIEDVYLLTTPSAECLDFWEACEDGDVDKVQASLSAGVDVNITTPPQTEALTGLMYAAGYGHSEVAHLLLATGADPNIQNTNGFTALMCAAVEEYAQVAEVLLREGAHINAQNKEGTTALMLAALCGRAGVAEVLLREGADVTVQDEDGYTALHYAAQGGYTAIATSLLKASSDPNSMASWKGGTSPLMLAAGDGHLEMIDLLLSVGAEVNKTRDDGYTALMWAAIYGHVDAVKTLVERGADVNMLTEDGLSALDLAKEGSHIDVCKMLEKCGAKQTGPDSQERAKKGIAKFIDRMKKILKPSFISRLADLDIGGMRTRKAKKQRATGQISY